MQAYLCNLPWSSIAVIVPVNPSDLPLAVHFPGYALRTSHMHQRICAGRDVSAQYETLHL